MASKKNIASVVEELVLPILEPDNYELVDVEFVKEGSQWYLKIFIDVEGGVKISDCVSVSRAVEAKLDEVNPIEQAYILEVSSPGLDRPLKKEKDFRRSIGKLVEVKTFKPINGEKEFVAELMDLKDNEVYLKLENDETLVLPRKEIALIRLAVIF